MKSALENKNTLPANFTPVLLAAIVALAIGSRVYVSFFSGLPIYNTDTYDYFRMADGILNESPISYFPNGYPLIIAVTKYLVGETSLPSALILLNVTLSTAVVLLTFGVARKLLSPSLSLIATGLVALSPNQLNYVRQLLSEVPSEFFLVLGIFLVTTRREALAALAGFALFFSGMIRSTLSPFGFIASGYLYLAGQRKKAIILAIGLLLGVIFSSTLYRVGMILPSSNFGSNLLISINSGSAGDVVFSTEKFSAQEQDNPIPTYLKFAADNPSTYLRQRFAFLWELWGPWPKPGDAQSPRSTASRLLIGIRFPGFVLAVWAVWILRKNSTVILYFLPILLITMVHVAFFSSPRFTYPIEPFLIVLATRGAYEFWRRLMYTTYWQKSRFSRVTSQ